MKQAVTVLFMLLASKIFQAIRIASEGELNIKVFANFGVSFSSVFTDRFFAMTLSDFLFGMIATLLLWFYIRVLKNGEKDKKYRNGEEYGSAVWGTKAEIVPFLDPVFENNVLLTQTERMRMSDRPPNVLKQKDIPMVDKKMREKMEIWTQRHRKENDRSL